jgi:hypothetical protein
MSRKIQVAILGTGRIAEVHMQGTHPVRFHPNGRALIPPSSRAKKVTHTSPDGSKLKAMMLVDLKYGLEWEITLFQGLTV